MSGRGPNALMPSHPRLYLKPGRERSLVRHHPWIFSGAVEHVESGAEAGDTIEIVAADGRRLALAAFSPQSQITARVWTFDPDAPVDGEMFRARIERACAFRERLARPEGSRGAERLVNAESDGIPGLVVDRYADVVVCQFLSAGAERWRDVVVEELSRAVPAATLYERSDVDVRTKEGLPPRAGLLHGAEPPAHVEIQEGPCRFLIDVRAGHKTGFYLDQRDNRFVLREHVAGKSVLNCFAYTGAFAVHALAAGATSAVNIESSADALALAERHVQLNGMDASRLEQTHGDVFDVLRRYRDSRRTFDVIVLDPPKFAESKSQVDRAARGYKDINLLAFKLLRPGGLLMTFSCSGAVVPDLFQKIVADAALDAGQDARILARLSQAADHPAALAFPEAAYLKGLLCAV